MKCSTRFFGLIKKKTKTNGISNDLLSSFALSVWMGKFVMMGFSVIHVDSFFLCAFHGRQDARQPGNRNSWVNSLFLRCTTIVLGVDRHRLPTWQHMCSLYIHKACRVCVISLPLQCSNIYFRPKEKYIEIRNKYDSFWVYRLKGEMSVYIDTWIK